MTERIIYCPICQQKALFVRCPFHDEKQGKYTINEDVAIIRETLSYALEEKVSLDDSLSALEKEERLHLETKNLVRCCVDLIDKILLEENK